MAPQLPSVSDMDDPDPEIPARFHHVDRGLTLASDPVQIVAGFGGLDLAQYLIGPSVAAHETSIQSSAIMSA